MIRPGRSLAALTAFVVLLAGAGAALAIQTTYLAGLKAEGSKLSATATVAAELVDREMQSVEVLSQATVEQPAFGIALGRGTPGAFDRVAMQEILDQVAALRPEYQFAAVADTSGRVLAAGPASAALVGQDLSSRDWYRGITRTGKPYISSAYASSAPGNPLLVAVATPLRARIGTEPGPPTGPLLGFFWIGYRIGGLQSFMDHLDRVEGVDLELIDQAGTLMTHTGGIEGKLITQPTTPELAAALAGRNQTNLSGSVISASSPVAAIGWAVRATTPLSATATVSRRLTTGIAALVLWLFLAFAAIWLVRSRRRLARTNELYAVSEVQLNAALGSQSRSLREMRILSEASQDLVGSLEPGLVMRALVGAAGKMCSAPGEPQRRASVLIIEGLQYTISAESDIEGLASTEGMRLPLSEHPYLQRVIANPRAVVAALDYAEFGPKVAASMERAGVKNAAWLPIRYDGEVYAVLAVSGRQHDLIDADQLARLRTLTAIGEMALKNATAHQRMSQLALTDPLTGLANRRGLSQRMEQLPRSSFTVMAIDIDNLKVINDTHGHAAGDRAIRSVARTMARELRPSDVLARIGGDEFVAVLLDCDDAGARRLSDRLRDAVAAIDLPSGPTTISLGFALGSPGTDPESLLRPADEALYKAKASGKQKRARAGAETYLSGRKTSE